MAVSLFAAFPAQAVDGSACDEDEIRASIQSGDLYQAFEDLKLCEHDGSASAEALLLLAHFYFDDDLNDRETWKESHEKAWALVERAALMGSPDAVDTLATIYSTGDALLGYPPEENLETCLLDIPVENDRVSTKAVEACLGTP